MFRSIISSCALLGLAVLLSGGMGCAISDSISTSSESISDSSKSFSKSSDSSSNSSSGEEQAYREDVSSFTLAFLELGPSGSLDSDAFARRLRPIAEAHGVSDWESSPATFLAIGAGLQRAGVSDDEARAFGERMLDADAHAMHLLMDGYREAGELS